MKFRYNPSINNAVDIRPIKDFIHTMLSYGFNMHSFMFIQDDQCLYEEYFSPFSAHYLHREYSQTKSLVALAIGLLIDEGKLDLSSHVIDFFQDKMKHDIPSELEELTIKDLLTMQSCFDATYWFNESADSDRASNYVNSKVHRSSGLFWRYDTEGAELLSILVEKLSGMPLIDYLKSKVFNEMGSFQDALMLRCPHNYSWGDSGLLATTRDMASFAYLLMNNGKFNGQQFISEKYVLEMTSKQVDNTENLYHRFLNQGYGYLTWIFGNDNFGFVGMGDQLTFINKKHKFIFICNADNQAVPNSTEILLDGFTKLVDALSKEKNQYIKKIEPSNFLLDNQLVVLKENQMKIKWFKLSLDKGLFTYENATGIKSIPFKINENVHTTFPEDGYSDLIGKEKTKNHFYQCITTAKYLSERKLFIKVNIVDKYFGELDLYITYNQKEVYLRMNKAAENFLNEYQGEALGYIN